MQNSQWIKHIDYLRTKINSESSRENIFEAIKESVISNLPNEPLGILLSGGIDSSLIAKICKDYGADFRCFCVGIKDSEDIKVAKDVAKILNLELIFKEYDIEEIEKILLQVIDILPYPVISNDNYIEYMVKISVSAVMLSAIKLGEERIFLSGIGAEELFAGYHRHSLSINNGGKWRGNEIKELEEESWDGIKRLNNLVIQRDELIAKEIGKEIRNPYINDEVIIHAMSLGTEKKIDQETNKKILREIAANLGVPSIAYQRKKKGAQYGSGFDKAITKLAKKKGFKLKKRYIDRLLENRKK